MNQLVPRRRRPWTVGVAVAATILHALFLVLGFPLMVDPFDGLLGYLALALLVLAAHWMFVSAAYFRPGGAQARRNGLAGTATLVGLELLCLASLLYDTLFRVCAPGGCGLDGAKYALFEMVLFLPPVFLGAATILLLRARSASAYFLEPRPSGEPG